MYQLLTFKDFTESYFKERRSTMKCAARILVFIFCGSVLVYLHFNPSDSTKAVKWCVSRIIVVLNVLTIEVDLTEEKEFLQIILNWIGSKGQIQITCCIPHEILARDPKAQRAYQGAIKFGKMKNCLPVCVVNQSGKNGLLNSLVNGDRLYPTEDNSVGAKLQHSFICVEDSHWRTVNQQTCFHQSTARAMVDRLEIKAIATNPADENGDVGKNDGDYYDEDNKDDDNGDLPNAKLDNVGVPTGDVGSDDGKNGVQDKDGDNDDKVDSTNKERHNILAGDEDSEDEGTDETLILTNAVPRSLCQKMVEVPVEEVMSEEDCRNVSDAIQERAGDNAKSRRKAQETLDEENAKIFECTALKNLTEEIARYIAIILLENPDLAKQIDNSLFLTAMDIQGQSLSSISHLPLLPRKGIFLLEYDLDNDLHAQAQPPLIQGSAESKIDSHCPLSNLDRLGAQLSLIAANSTQEGGRPHVILVCTCSVVLLQNQNPKETARKIIKNLKRKNYQPGVNVVRDIFVIDRANYEDDLARLRSVIAQIGRSLQVYDDIPLRWWLFEEKLFNLVMERKLKFISPKQAGRIAEHCGMSPNSNELETLLNYLHDLRLVFYFPDANIIIIDKQWLLKVFSQVTIIQPIEKWEDEYEEDRRRLEEDGVMNLRFMEHLLNNLLDDPSMAGLLVSVMEKFAVICRWKQPKGPDLFLVPDRLMHSDAQKANALVENASVAAPLVVRFHTEHVGFGLFPRLMIAVHQMCNSMWPCHPPHKDTFTRNFARFYDVGDKESNFSLVLLSDVQTITVAVIKERDKLDIGLQDSLKQLCQCILCFLKSTLEEMISSTYPLLNRLEFDFCIRCPICDNTASCGSHNRNSCFRDSCRHFITEEELMKENQPRCYECPTIPDSMIPKTAYAHWFHRTGEMEQCVPSKHQITPLASNSIEDSLCKDVVALVEQHCQLSEMEAKKAAIAVALKLGLDNKTVDNPPEHLVTICRKSCKYLCDSGNKNVVQALQTLLPAGLTGPVEVPHGTLVKDMDIEKKEHLAEALSSRPMVWKAFAQQVNLSPDTIGYLDERIENPALRILDKHCGSWPVEKLYNSIVISGAEATADSYL